MTRQAAYGSNDEGPREEDATGGTHVLGLRTDGADDDQLEEVRGMADIAHRLAACESKLMAVYARLQGARERIERLERENHRLREQSRRLQDPGLF